MAPVSRDHMQEFVEDDAGVQAHQPGFLGQTYVGMRLLCSRFG